MLGRDHRWAVDRDGKGVGPVIADGVYEMPSGIILCEYDHGRYTACQVLHKLSGFRSPPRLEGRRLLGTVWGAPTERRAAWLCGLGVRDIVIIDPESWLGRATKSP